MFRNLPEAAGFLVQVRNFEEPALGLASGVLAGDAVEPAFNATGQQEKSS